MQYGVSYYPEHKQRQELLHDIELLVKSGINTVRMGEFAWCRMEPTEGEYQFGWLDEAVELLGKSGISTIICTPTACPPAWLVEKHPDMLYVDNRGITRPFGGRRHYCYNNEAYRAYSEKIARAVGEHYGKNPYVSGFQIDNELAQEGTGRCHCAVCQNKFRTWLGKKYGTIEEFNRRSGGIFWSQEYTSFEQIRMPVNTIEVGAMQQINAFYENPTVRLDYERFCSDSMTEYQNIQAQVLKSGTDYPVTTNATGLATNSIDYYKSTQTLDNYAFDYYPGLRNATVDSFPYAFARGVKNGKPFWVLEFMSGGGHRLSGSGRLQPNPGALQQAVIHSFAHGAEMMLHFQFRSYPIGAEQLNYAIVDMDGVPRRRYFEMQDTARILKQLASVEKSEFVNETAVCFDYSTHWALRIKPANDPDFNYLDFCGEFYNNLSAIGVNADVVSFDEDLSRYKLVIVPSPFLLDKAHQNKLKAYVENGGTLVTTFLASVKNEDNVGYTDTLPAGLTDLFGVTVEEVEPVFTQQNSTELSIRADGAQIQTKDRYWSELLKGEPSDADIAAEYTQDYKKGSKVISCNRFGKGFACYLGTGVDQNAMRALLSAICKKSGVQKHPFTCTEKVEVVRRRQNEKNVYFLFNFSQQEQEVAFQGCYQNLLSGEQYKNKFSIPQNGYLVITE